MKTTDEINKALDNLQSTADTTEFPAITYEAGWEEALMLVLKAIGKL